MSIEKLLWSQDATGLAGAGCTAARWSRANWSMAPSPGPKG